MENNFIDLSSMPRKNNGDIDWNNVIGCVLPFNYNNISGNINIVGIVPTNKRYKTIKVYIDGYTRTDYDLISQQSLINCSIGRLLHKKIIDTNPELIDYFVDKECVCKYSIQSNMVIEAKCPFCGFKKDYRIYNLYRFGFSCPRCSDGISYPNKFMFSLLSQLKIDFKNEISKSTIGFEWVQNYRYDFYFEKNNKKYFIEMDGKFHDNYENMKIDAVKDDLANRHNIFVIRINCKYTGVEDRFKFVKTNILQSYLSKLFDLSNIDWDLCNKDAVSSILHKSVELYKKYGYDIIRIAQELSVGRGTVRHYLKIASDIGLCDYDVSIAKTNRYNKIKNIICKPVDVFKNDEFICSFKSREEASLKSLDVLGRFFDPCTIGRICSGDIKERDGFYFRNSTIQN